jgi:hypothetical protein
MNSNFDLYRIEYPTESRIGPEDALEEGAA